MTDTRDEAAAISLRDPNVVLAGIKQFGLAPDGSDLRDLASIFATLSRQLAEAQITDDQIRAIRHAADVCEGEYIPGGSGELCVSDILLSIVAHAAAMGTKDD